MMSDAARRGYRQSRQVGHLPIVEHLTAEATGARLSGREQTTGSRKPTDGCPLGGFDPAWVRRAPHTQGVCAARRWLIQTVQAKVRAGRDHALGSSPEPWPVSCVHAFQDVEVSARMRSGSLRWGAGKLASAGLRSPVLKTGRL